MAVKEARARIHRLIAIGSQFDNCTDTSCTALTTSRCRTSGMPTARSSNCVHVSVGLSLAKPSLHFFNLPKFDRKNLMTYFRVFLLISTVLIYAMTIIAVGYHGFNWPAVAIQDLADLNWRSQFDTDFIIYLLIGSTWISWREGFTAKGHTFGFLNVFLGGMFGFPYLLYASLQANGNPTRILLGVHASRDSTPSSNV